MMKAKDQIRVPCCLLLSWSVLCVVFLSVDAQDEGEKFVKRCEENVKNVALSASMNDGNCDLLNNCKSECSRVVCSPLNADLQSSLCVRVEVNDICPPTETNQSCNLYMKACSTCFKSTVVAWDDSRYLPPKKPRWFIQEYFSEHVIHIHFFRIYERSLQIFSRKGRTAR